ncbi:MAG: hypothetical protein SAK29_28800 [Scytonema sp. PMC 1069.18]|nr:hypothetical protein [Scytonema sp. PMC 1069.18]MEC4881093.1 hypothetical protein [Scytonema sp. PMC 1070.18]
MKSLKQSHADRRKEIATCREETWILVFSFPIEHELLPVDCPFLHKTEG